MDGSYVLFFISINRTYALAIKGASYRALRVADTYSYMRNEITLG